MTNQPIRVLLANHWHDDNRGDSAITQGILTLLRGRWPEAKVTVTTLAETGDLWAGSGRHLASASSAVTLRPSPAPTELRGRAGARSRGQLLLDTAILWVRSVPTLAALALARPLPAWRRLINDHDVVVLAGGSNVFDDAGVPAVLSLPRLVAVLGPAYTAVKLGKPVLLLGHTLGPFARKNGRRLAARMLRDVDLAVVREAGSVATADQLGVRVVEEGADMAFALTPSRTSRVDRMLSELPVAPDRTLMLSVRQHPTQGSASDDRLIAEFSRAARSLVASGSVDGIAVIAHTTGPTPVEDDRPMSQRLVDELADLPVVLVTEDATPSELSAFYGAACVVVAVRLHAAILALNAGTPTFAVSYLTAKTQGVMTQVGLPDAVAEFGTVTAEEIVDGVHRLLYDPQLRQRLRRRALERRADMTQASLRWLEVERPKSADLAEPAGVAR